MARGRSRLAAIEGFSMLPVCGSKAIARTFPEPRSTALSRRPSGEKDRERVAPGNGRVAAAPAMPVDGSMRHARSLPGALDLAERGGSEEESSGGVQCEGEGASDAGRRDGPLMVQHPCRIKTNRGDGAAGGIGGEEPPSAGRKRHAGDAGTGPEAAERSERVGFKLVRAGGVRLERPRTEQGWLDGVWLD